MSLSPNTQAILLLTAPLIAGRDERSSDLLTLSEYKRLARFLRDKQRQPADLLAPDAQALLGECQQLIDSDRLKSLLARGFLLSQAIERWRTRAIWVVTRADAEYPRRLKTRLKNDAPPVLYACGDAAILDSGGLAVVGSRHVDDRAVLNREHRNLLMDGQLVLISPYDPSAGFNVGHAMQRNKLIYALADAALVVSSDYQKGGTWAGAVEQLEKLRLVPVYIRSNGETSKGMEALRRKGALSWPNPETPGALAETLVVEASVKENAFGQNERSFSVREEPNQAYDIPPSSLPSDDSFAPPSLEAPLTPADALFAKVRELLEKMTTPKTDAEVATDLQVSKSQAKEWLQRLVDEGVLEKLSRPVRYRSVSSQPLLFDRRD